MLRKSVSEQNDGGTGELGEKQFSVVKVPVCGKAGSTQKFMEYPLVAMNCLPILLSFKPQVCYLTLIHLLHYNVTGSEYTGSKKEGCLLTEVTKNCYFGVSKEYVSCDPNECDEKTHCREIV